MKASEVLRAARKLIERPEAWTQGADARDANGEPTWSAANGEPTWAGTEPTCWCAGGAVIHVANFHQQPNSSAYSVLQAVVDGWVSHWNDTEGRTHPEVLAAFDKAIELAESSESPVGGREG